MSRRRPGEGGNHRLLRKRKSNYEIREMRERKKEEGNHAEKTGYTSNSATRNVWSDGFSFSRGARSMKASVDFAASGGVARTWSTRHPMCRWTAFFVR